MKLQLVTATALTVLSACLGGCSSTGSTASSTAPATALTVREKLGGNSSLTGLASVFVTSSLQDPRLSALTAGKNIDASAVTDKVSNQLCYMLGAGCQPPLTDAQLRAAASRVSPDQSKAISDNFGSALNSVVSDPAVRQLVTNAVGSELPGVLAGLL